LSQTPSGGATKDAQSERSDRRPAAERADGFATERQWLGSHLRQLRHERALTSRQLAIRAGVSPSLISQLENGRIDASVVTLRRIAASLDVPIADFFHRPDDAEDTMAEQAPGSTPEPLARVVRRGQRKRLQIPESNFVFELLTPDLQGQIEFVWFEREPGQPQEESMAHRQGGEECALVLQGTMHLVIGDQEYVLGPGDSCVFDPGVPHRTENRGKTKLIQISAITPPSF
jgi:transcriptional regulator with XRE-family HTH domain